ncbi:hypothetical protein B0T18DRAFT_29302 [Schizothecium vesticola]|uniref:HMG box domain-containing protein n=1 Tax=Schizothecium vesticola TaxID=314040 RepID=A0AA40FAK1_9PEZI|nr:hypothetical protein B0T18DRAFT_29302 [Schizothecium vesticola]
MDRNTPTSPGPPHRTEPLKAEPIPSGFQELIQHNNNHDSLHPPPPQPYHHRGSAGMESINVHSQSGPRYGTPGPAHGHNNNQYNNRAGSGQLQGYHQSMYSHESSPYGPIPETRQPYSTPATSPPTPSRASELKKTRSGNVIHKAGFSKALAPKRAAVEKSTPSSKKAKKKGNKNAAALSDMAGISGPLSELTKDSKIQLIDIPAFITRPIEERLRETEEGKNPGHIKRPMNAFMLYRKAYQGRAKEYMKQLNHQVVSTVCGTSWKRETLAFREQFKEWADIERQNHKEAFPDYKFAPTKPKPKPKVAGRADSEDIPVLDPYWADRELGGSNRAANTPSRGGLDSEYTPPRSLYGLPPYAYGDGISPHNRSAFEYTNPGKQLPQPYDHRDLGGTSYYETQVHQRQPRMHHPGVVEDVMLHKTPSPGLSFSANQGRGNMHSQYSLNQYPTHSPGMEAQQLPPPPQPQRFEHRIDPSLMGHEGGMYDAGSVGNLFFEGSNIPSSHQTWQPSMHLAGNQDNEGNFTESYLSGDGGGGGLDETLSVGQQAQFLRGAHEWEIEPLADSSAFDGGWGEK